MYLFLFFFQIRNFFHFNSKLKIKILIEETFTVKVISVNTYILPGKRKRLGKFQGLKNSYKRAYVKVIWFNLN